MKIKNISKNPKSLPGKPSLLLLISLAFAVLIFGVIWFNSNNYNTFKTAVLSIKDNDGHRAIETEILNNTGIAENHFRNYLNSKSKEDYRLYLTDLNLLKRNIDSFLQSIPQSKKEVNADIEINDILLRKQQLSGEVVHLRGMMDTLISNMLLDTAFITSTPKEEFELKKGATTIKDKTDTLTLKTQTVKKKKLIKRIADAISNKNAATETNTKVIIDKSNQLLKSADSIKTKMYDNAYKSYRSQIDAYLDTRETMMIKERVMISLNLRLRNDLLRIFSSLNDLEKEARTAFKKDSLAKAEKSAALVNNVATVSLLLVLIFWVGLYYFIKQNLRYQQLLLKEKEEVQRLSQEQANFFAMATHEIRNPLNAIVGMIAFLKQDIANADEQMLDSLDNASKMLNNTVSDILSAGKLESDSFYFNQQPFYPLSEIRNTVSTFKKTAHVKGLSLTDIYSGMPDTTAVTGDKIRMLQVLQNLITNALKFTDKGSINISAHLTEEKNELWLTVVVNDTGKGISETHQKDLFSKYFQASPGQGYTGTGLGLYICRQIVEKQGGKINASSIQGKGSKFIFEIPFKKYEGDGPVQKKIVTDDEVLKGKKVLLVDDNEINLMLNAMILGKKGMIVKKAFNGLDAIKLLEEEGFDVLISDIHMPLMGGYELLEHIKTGNKKFSSIPVILLSGDESGLPSEGNVHPYKKLVKPVSGKQIGDTLSELFSTKIL